MKGRGVRFVIFQAQQTQTVWSLAPQGPITMHHASTKRPPTAPPLCRFIYLFIFVYGCSFFVLFSFFFKL